MSMALIAMYCSLGYGNLDYQNSEIDSSQQMREQVLITLMEMGFDRLFCVGIPEVGAMGKESTADQGIVGYKKGA